MSLAAVQPSSPRFERKREAILRAAAALFNARGVKGATLADVAAEVGLNLKSIRYYFVRKEDLVAAAFMRSIEFYNGLIDQAAEAPTVEGRVRRFLDGYFHATARVWRGEQPQYLHFGDIRSLAEPHAPMVFAAYNGMFRNTRRLLASPELQAAGRAVLNARTHLLLAQVLGSVIWVARYEPEDFARVAARTHDILFNGLAASPWQWPPQIPELRMPVGDPARISQESFLRAATQLINDQGYRGASVEKISARLNVTKGSFYYHNDAKDDLVVECFQRTFEMMRAAQEAAAAEAGSGFDKVAIGSAALIRHQLTEKGPLLRTSALSAVPEPIRCQMTQRMDQITSRFADALTDGIIDGSVRPCDPWIGAQMITELINSTGELQRWSAATAETAVGLYAKPLFLGLLCAP